MRFRPGATLVVLAGAVALAPVQAQKAPALPDILKSAATYVVEYSQRIGAVEAEESLLQRETTGNAFGPGHTWKAEVVLLGYGNGEITTFRDIFSLEEKKTRERDSRIFHLFRTDPPSAVAQAETVTMNAGQSAMGAGMAALNSPTLSLIFLREENQSHCTFKLDGTKNDKGAQVATVRFTETAKPRLIPGTDGGTVQGRFLIDTATGTVRLAELLFTNDSLDAKATTIFALESKLQIWLPVSLDSRYEMTGRGAGGATNLGRGNDANQYGTHQTIEAQAKFTNYQQTAVDLTKLGK